MKTEAKLISIIQATVEDKPNITAATDLRKELHLDSFGTVMLINSIEEAFGIEIDEADFAQVKTVSDVIALLESKYDVCELA